MSLHHPRRRKRLHHDDVFLGTCVFTGIAVYVGYGILLIQIAGGR